MQLAVVTLSSELYYENGWTGASMLSLVDISATHRRLRHNVKTLISSHSVDILDVETRAWHHRYICLLITTDAHKHTPAVFSTTHRKVVAYFPSILLLGILKSTQGKEDMYWHYSDHRGGEKKSWFSVLFSFCERSQTIYQGSLSSTEGTSDKHLETDGVI